MKNLILGAILLAIIGAIIYYLYKSKKRGDVCPGCSYGKCPGSCHSCGGAAKKG